MRERRTYSSPPCFLHEVDPVYAGYLSGDETIEFLNTLLEAERAGARGVGDMSRDPGNEELRPLLAEVAEDEARFCGMLTAHIKRLGGRPSRVTGNFYGKLLARESLRERLEFLDRGQSWVVKELREKLPRIHDDALHADLRQMLTVHEQNIARCRLPDAQE